MPQAPYNDLAQQQLEAALRVARMTLDGAEKLIRLQLETAKQTVEDSARTAARLSEVKDVQSALAVRTELTEHAASSLLNLSRNVYELAAQAQGELVHMAQQQAQANQKLFAEGLENVSKASPAGGDVMSSALKSSFAATQAAFDSLTKAARQVTEFADASMKAAGTVAGEAMKTKARAK
ncbi:MAG: phasin family protein [Burkholderiales bacterium]|nr:phasin family protein [Burkholderiales bacterium]